MPLIEISQILPTRTSLTLSWSVFIWIHYMHSLSSWPFRNSCLFIISLIYLIHTPTFTEPFPGSQESWHAYRISFISLFPFMSCKKTKQEEEKEDGISAWISLQTKYCIKKQTWPSLSLCNDIATFSLCRVIIMSRNSSLNLFTPLIVTISWRRHLHPHVFYKLFVKGYSLGLICTVLGM